MGQRSSALASSARRVAAVVLTLSWGLACKQILDVPQDPIDAVEAASRYCECEGLPAQGVEVGGRCDDALGVGGGEPDDADYAHARAALEAGCTACPFKPKVDGKPVEPDLQKLGRCYGEITGAKPPPAACNTSADCTTFACCATEIQYGISADGTRGLLSKNACCESCSSCAATDDHALAALTLCAETIPIFEDYASCLCSHRKATNDPCGTEFGGPCSNKLDFCGLAACRECLLTEYGDECQPEIDACRNDIPRPVHP